MMIQSKLDAFQDSLIGTFPYLEILEPKRVVDVDVQPCGVGEGE